MNNINIQLYKTMYLIREAEETIRKNYHSDEMKTPMHLCVGAEAIAAGVIGALKLEDQVLCTYRSHGVYLAKTHETDKFFAELYGRVGGMARGKAGSMHLSAPEQGFLGASAVVGTPIPVAVGCALANQMQKNKKMTAVFFGDGATDEGVFWESLNFASLKKLPVIFICEDNDLAIHTKKADRHGYDSIANIVSKFNCNVYSYDSTDVETIYNLVHEAIKKFASDQKPIFIYLKYYRYYEHVGINFDFSAGYRPKEEYEEWLKKDPIKIQREKLIKLGVSDTDIHSIENPINAQIEESVRKALASPLPLDSTLYEEVLL